MRTPGVATGSPKELSVRTEKLELKAAGPQPGESMNLSVAAVSRVLAGAESTSMCAQTAAAVP